MKRLTTVIFLLLAVLSLTGCCIKHDFQPATCTRPEICSKCGKERGSALGHTEALTPPVAPTCTETGLTEGRHCSVCGEVLVPQEEIPALGHTEVTDSAVAPTCTEAGLTEGRHCSVCGEVLVPQEEVPALGHTEVTDSAVAPTCTEAGLTEGGHCSVCGKVFVSQEIIPATGHNFTYPTYMSGGVCTVCGEKNGGAPHSRLFTNYVLGTYGSQEADNEKALPEDEDTAAALKDSIKGKHIEINGKVSGIDFKTDKALSLSELKLDFDAVDDETLALGITVDIPLKKDIQAIFTLNGEEFGAYFPGTDDNYYCIPMEALSEIFGVSENDLENIKAPKENDSKASRELLEKYLNILFDAVKPEDVEEIEGEYKYLSADAGQECTVLTITSSLKEIVGALNDVLLTARHDEKLHTALETVLIGVYNSQPELSAYQTVDEFCEYTEDNLDSTIDYLVNVLNETADMDDTEVIITVAFDGERLYAVCVDDGFSNFFYEACRTDESTVDTVIGKCTDDNIHSAVVCKKTVADATTDTVISVPDIGVQAVFSRNSDAKTYSGEVMADIGGAQAALLASGTEESDTYVIYYKNRYTSVTVNLTAVDAEYKPILPDEKVILKDKELL